MRLAAIIAVALATITAPGMAAGGATAAALPSASSSKLCAPAESARAYVTTLADEEPGRQALGPRVLAQSLRSAGAKGDIVVLVPLDRAHGKTVDSLRRDGLTVHIVPRGLQTARGDVASEDLMIKIFLWSLTAYDRVVYLDPRSLILKNPDALFACEGFCAAGAVPQAGSEPGPTPGEGDDAAAQGSSWYPSTSVMVLEPSITVHNEMLRKLRKTPLVGSSLDAQTFVSTFLEVGDHCAPFEDLDSGPGMSGPGMEVGGGGDRGGVEVIPLEEALQPVLLLNGEHMPKCAKGRQRTAPAVCQRLPYTYAAPAADSQLSREWAKGGDGAMSLEGAEPHIIHFAEEDVPWKRLAYLHKPLFWRWNKIREQLQNPYGQFFSPWLSFFVPCIVLAFARVYYKTAGLSSNGGSEANEESASKRGVGGMRNSASQSQLPALPTSATPAPMEGGAVNAASYAVEPSGTSSPCVGGRAPGSADACSPGFAARLRLSPAGVSLIQSIVAVAFGLVWFRATRVLSREVVDISWHPLISIAVYNAWLCSALVVGLFVMDYSYYVVVTRARTLWRDALVVATFVWGVALLHYRKSSCWGLGAGVGVIALGLGHGSRREASKRLTTRMQFRCITASCVVEAAVSLAVCYSGASTHDIGSRRAHAVAGVLQMVFTALVYAAVFGTHLLRAGVDGAGLTLERSSRLSGVRSAEVSAASSAIPGTSEMGGSGSTGHEVASASSSVREGLFRWGSRPDDAKVGSLNAVGMWVKELLWQRRVVMGCAILLLLWSLAASLLPKTPVRRLEQYGQVCLGNKDGFVEPGGKRLAKVCGPEEALLPVKTDLYFEAFRQDKVCLQLAGGGFLTLGRVHAAQACTPENQFVFQQVKSSKAKSKVKPGSHDALSSAPAAGSRDAGEYCVYNPTKGFYLSAQTLPRSSCGPQERWRLEAAPSPRGVSRGRAKPSHAHSTVSMLLHPDFFSQGPLHTVYGYLLATTALLVARAVFAKLASTKGGAAAEHGGEEGPGARSGAGSRQRYGGAFTRQRSRRQSRPRARHQTDAWLGDAGYAGDAEAGGLDCGESSGSRSTAGEGYRSLSESPVPRQDHMAWGLDLVSGLDEEEGADARPARTLRSRGGAAAGVPPVPKPPRPGPQSSRWDGFLGKLFSVLCMCCDATLLAGLWCLVPTHLAQALSALVRDHHVAIAQGLGMGGSSPSTDGDDALSRGLNNDGVILVDPSGALPGLDAGEADEAGVAISTMTCDSGAWWVTSLVLRWHVVLLLVAFCHLHGAAAATASAVTKGRDRRTGKRARESASFWGLRADEALAMRLRTGLGVLVMLCVVTTTTGAELVGGGSILGLHIHPSWSRCAPAAGLDGSWGGVSPLLVFGILAAAAGVYIRAGATRRVRVGAVLGLVGSALAVGVAVGRVYLLLALLATGMDWCSWGIAGLLSCVCYQGPPFPKIHRESSGSAVSDDEDSAGGRFGAESVGARLRGMEDRRSIAGNGRGREGRRKRDAAGGLGRVGVAKSAGGVVV